MTRMVERRPRTPVGALGMEITVDPSGHYAGIKPHKLMQAAGSIPTYIAHAAMTPDADDTMKVAQILVDSYGSGMPVEYNMLNPSKGSRINHEGVYYYYPEEPGMYPLIEFKLEYVTVYIYEYALVGVDDGQTQWMQRFD